MTCQNSRPWSRKSNSCIICGTTSVPHAGRGFCKRCYAKITYAEKHGIPPPINGKKRWSRKYDACISCGTTDTPHMARGLCTACYLKDQYNTKVDYTPRTGWSREWSSCQICGATSSRHVGHGICSACKSRVKWLGSNNPVYKELLAIRKEAKERAQLDTVD